MRKPDSIRCFIAIEIPKKIQNLILEIQRTLQDKISGATWTKSGNHHLTLKFLGNVEQDQITRIEDILYTVSTRIKQFYIEIGGLGVFPDWKHPRVLWLGLTKGKPKITALSESINKDLENLHYPIDSRFHPHLTLARFKKKVNIQKHSNSFTEFEKLTNSGFFIDEFTLLKSELHPKGAIYTPINTFKLC